ncbi:MAG: TOBE domain-containing protein [Helicobacteraceae bacterium]|jgi:molybdate transport system regulatory protein|nr:TOBE domain-containing protein [Helicobacteraceae bacterium]
MEVGGRVWLDINDRRFLGGGRIALLKQIGKVGSINQAAKNLKMSYKTAWDSIDAMNNLSPAPLVESARGGKHGGGAKLTKAGEKLIELFEQLAKKHDQLMSELAKSGDDFSSLLETAQRITMKTSARNNLAGAIVAIKKDAINTEVELELSGSQRLAAVITNESAEQMSLKMGDQVYALIKSSWVILASEKPAKISARNVIEGEIANITNGAVNSEVKLAIKGGATIAAIITNESVKELALKKGDKAWALIKASHIILGA